MNTWLCARGEVNRESKSQTTPSFPAQFFIEHCNKLRAPSLNGSPNAAMPIGMTMSDQSREGRAKQRSISAQVSTILNRVRRRLTEPKRFSISESG